MDGDGVVQVPGRGSGEPRPGPPGPRFRRRALAVVLLVALMVGSGTALDRVLGPSTPARAVAPAARSGAWFCPHGGSSGWKGWVVVTNPGSEAVRVRVTSFGASGSRKVTTFTVEPERHVYQEVFAGDPAASTEVEYFGGWVGAAAVLRSSDPEGLAAERCVTVPQPAWYLPDATTGRGQTSSLVVMNPFAEAAEFDVVIRTEERVIRPGELTPYVLRPKRSVAIKLNTFALAGPNERTTTAEVVPRLGRVVAGGLGVGSEGVRMEAGIPRAETRWIIPGGRYEGGTAMSTLDPDARRTDLSIVLQGESSQKLVTGVAGVSVPGGDVRTFEAGRPEDAGVQMESTNQVPFIAARRLTGTDGDPATVNGTARTYRRWVVLPATPPSGGRSFLILQNPGRDPARVAYRLLGEAGAVAEGTGSATIGPGRTVVIGLFGRVGTTPASALVQASDGTIVAASASYGSGAGGYAATLGLPIVSSG